MGSAVATVICYLCRQPLQKGQGRSRDHVPPAQVYPAEYRKQDITKNLVTLHTHAACNGEYAKDEEYFVNTMLPFAGDTPAGWELWQQTARRYQTGKTKGIVNRVRAEFQKETSGGIVAPAGTIFKYYDVARVDRVAWKIVRGLYFIEEQRVLPVDWARTGQVLRPGDWHFGIEALRTEPSRGKHREVFDYRTVTVPGEEFNNFQLWGLLFWDRLIVLVWFHHPDCPCEACRGQGGSSASGA